MKGMEDSQIVRYRDTKKTISQATKRYLEVNGYLNLIHDRTLWHRVFHMVVIVGLLCVL